MTDSTQPEALRLAELLELAPEDGVEPQTTEDAAAELRRLHTENTALQQGYAAARLEIESLQARIKTMAEEHADELMVAHLDVRMLGRSTEPTVEYPLLPEHVGKVEVSTTLENSGLRRHKASPAYTPDQRRAYVDRAVRAEQPAGAQQPTQAQAGAVPLTDEQIEAARIEVFKVHGADLIPAVATTLARAIEAAHGIKGGQHGTE